MLMGVLPLTWAVLTYVVKAPMTLYLQQLGCSAAILQVARRFAGAPAVSGSTSGRRLRTGVTASRSRPALSNRTPCR
jgi:hypothetical protein